MDDEPNTPEQKLPPGVAKVLQRFMERGFHGARDTLAPVEEARYFADELRNVSQAPVGYAELKGAPHAFDLFCSPRTSHMLVAVLKFLDATHASADAETADVLLDDGVAYLGVAVR